MSNRSNPSSASGSGSAATSKAPPPPPLSNFATKLEEKLKKQDTANKDAFARKLKEEEVRHFHPMADIIAERLLSPKLLSEVRPIFHDFMLLRLSLRRMDKMLAAVERQTRRISKAVTRRRKMARSYVQQVAPSSPTHGSSPSASASSLASGPQPVALSARQTRFLKLKLEQVSQLEARLSAFTGSHPADTLSRPFTQYLRWQMGELANARKKIDAYGKDRGTQSDGGKSAGSVSMSNPPLSATLDSDGSDSGNGHISGEPSSSSSSGSSSSASSNPDDPPEIKAAKKAKALTKALAKAAAKETRKFPKGRNKNGRGKTTPTNARTLTPTGAHNPHDSGVESALNSPTAVPNPGTPIRSRTPTPTGAHNPHDSGVESALNSPTAVPNPGTPTRSRTPTPTGAHNPYDSGVESALNSPTAVPTHVPKPPQINNKTDKHVRTVGPSKPKKEKDQTGHGTQPGQGH